MCGPKFCSMKISQEVEAASAEPAEAVGSESGDLARRTECWAGTVCRPTVG